MGAEPMAFTIKGFEGRFLGRRPTRFFGVAF